MDLELVNDTIDKGETGAIAFDITAKEVMANSTRVRQIPFFNTIPLAY
jgi:hypothetical protein